MPTFEDEALEIAAEREMGLYRGEMVRLQKDRDDLADALAKARKTIDTLEDTVQTITNERDDFESELEDAIESSESYRVMLLDLGLTAIDLQTINQSPDPVYVLRQTLKNKL